MLYRTYVADTNEITEKTRDFETNSNNETIIDIQRFALAKIVASNPIYLSSQVN
jgi:hypothetical protein